MISHLLRLPPILQEKLAAALVSIHRKAYFTSLRKCCELLGVLRRLLGLLFSITPAVSVLRSMFTWLKMPSK